MIQPITCIPRFAAQVIPIRQVRRRTLSAPQRDRLEQKLIDGAMDTREGLYQVNQQLFKIYTQLGITLREVVNRK